MSYINNLLLLRNQRILHQLFGTLMDAQKNRRFQVKVQYCELNWGVLRILEQQGYISCFRIVQKNNKSKKQIQIVLSYQMPTISHIKKNTEKSHRGSFPRRKPDCILMSTPLGILSGQEALSLNVSGEILFEIYLKKK